MWKPPIPTVSLPKVKSPPTNIGFESHPPNVERPCFECGAPSAPPAKAQVRGGRRHATATSGPFISNKWAS